MHTKASIRHRREKLCENGSYSRASPPSWSGGIFFFKQKTAYELVVCDWSSDVSLPISGRGTVVTGRIETGIVNTGDPLEIVGIKETAKTTCTGVEMFRKSLDEGRAGENCGILLRGVERDAVERGQVLAKPKSISPHTKFEAEIYVLSKDEGGRHTPFMNNYRPQFYFRTTDVTGACELPEGTEMVMPGDNIKMVVSLIAPIAMDEGLKFAIREGGRTVGAGVVSKIVE